MLVSIIIINYNTFQITCECIESVIKWTKSVPYEIILVDNASPNDKPDEFLSKFPGIKLIKSKENGGFSKGNNLGIHAANGDVILLLNSDTYLVEDSISDAANFLQDHSDIGALSVRLTYPDGKLQHTARKFRSIQNEILDVFRPFLKMLPYHKRSGLMLNQYFKGDYNTYCDWVSGAFMMFNRSLLNSMPNKQLDDRFFMYGEDQLWCCQFKELGFPSYYFSETTVIHIHNASTSASKQQQILKKILELELYLYAYRNGKSISYQIFKLILTAKEMGRYYVKVLAFKLFKYKFR